ncbi:MAG TPA: Rpn family recombination-promoting nuclease/putative transposase, partial [Polyangium sp.]|nr:Rpn family recombination-promoting nuclease/putative transposase [Polyangium sp.]
PEILRCLLNDLLERTGDRIIEGIEYLPSEQLPLIPGFKLSILDVRCQDRSGARFVVEMQLVHVPGFDKRVVYNASKAYADQLKAGEPYTKLEDVVAISICDFALWPDDEQIANGLPLVPMLSRWNMRERTSLNHGLLQVQYAFLELPKVPQDKPNEAGAALWAWLFVHAPSLSEIPKDLPGNGYGEALRIANQMTFTKEELEAYHKAVDEIEQLRVLIAAKWIEGHKVGVAEGHKVGVAEGQKAGKTSAIFTIFAARGITMSEETRTRIANCTDPALIERWIGLAVTIGSADELLA